MSDRSLRSHAVDVEMASARFPLAALIEALDSVLEDPGPERIRQATAALQTLLATAGADGAYLEIDASPLPRVRFGAGTLAEGPVAARSEDGIRTDLVDSTGRVSLGRLWLDGPADPGETVARLISRAVEGAWTRSKVAQASERLAALDAATRGIANVLEVDTVLQLIVETVRDLVRARYAALGIVDSVGVIERFVTVGINPEVRERIGQLPRGHGLLGLIIRQGRAFRIPEIAEHPDSSGFPPHHPPMHSFLGVPVTVKGVSVGNLYLTEKIDASEFSEDDQALVETFALHAGIAIENARLHEQVQRLAIVEERERIAKDLHDGVIQSIYAVGLSLEDLPEVMSEDAGEAKVRIDRAIDALHMTIRDIRNFIMGLRPELLDQRDLVGSLVALAEEVRLNSMVEIETSIDAAAAAVAARARQGAGLPHHARGAVQHRPAFARHASGDRPPARGRVGAARDRRQRHRVRPRRGARILAPGIGQHGGTGGPPRRSIARRECGRRRDPYYRHTGSGRPPTRTGDQMTGETVARPLRLLVVDDHEVVRQGLVALLDRRQGFEVVAEAGTAAEAVEQARRYEPDIVVMDVRLPDGSGVEACREIRAERAATRVVMLTSYPDEEAVLSAIVAGASGYLLKQVRARDLVAALEAVGRGESLLDPAVTEKVLERVRRIATGAAADDLAALTTQEQKILLLVAEGKTNKEIAAEVFLSDKTVKNYVSSILSKLNLERRAQAAAYMARLRGTGTGS